MSMLPEPAADAGSGRDAEARQRRVAGRARASRRSASRRPRSRRSLPTYLDRFRRGGWYAREPPRERAAALSRSRDRRAQIVGRLAFGNMMAALRGAVASSLVTAFGGTAMAADPENTLYIDVPAGPRRDRDAARSGARPRRPDQDAGAARLL